jgi:hypothetical protein
VRTTLTLDDDVAAKLRAAARSTGRPFRQVVNDAIRRGLLTSELQGSGTFEVVTRDLGDLRPGLTLDNVAELLELVEGSTRR